jgi:transcription antitermination factor NusB
VSGLRKVERTPSNLPLVWWISPKSYFLKMKTAHDPRHQARRETVKELFAQSFAPQKSLNDKVNAIMGMKSELDSEIGSAATEWPINKLNKIDLAILRLAVYELKHEDTPPKVVIDEAVELAKEFGSENSSSFINGVLGTIYKDESEI